jgi:hypothetical protein
MQGDGFDRLVQRESDARSASQIESVAIAAENQLFDLSSMSIEEE